MIEEWLMNVLERNGENIVESLSMKYGFSKTEGMKEVKMGSIKVEVSKEKVKRSERSKIPLPFCGEIQVENCRGIRLNHGLYTQCTNVHDNYMNNGHSLCVTCYKQTEKNSNGRPTYGYISERIEQGDRFIDPKGKAPVLYGNIMEKLNITRQEAEREAANLGMTIPEEQFQVKKSQRGRPKKNVVAVDTSGSELSTASVSEDEVKKPRGRPKKEKKVVSTVGEEVIKSLVKDAAAANKPSMKTDTEKKHDIKGANKECSSGSLVVPPEREQPSPPKIISTPPQDLLDNESSDEEEEELAVVEFKIDGIKYLKASNNTLYCAKTHEEVGIWNPKTKKIDPAAESDED